MKPNLYIANCNVGLGVFANKQFEPGERILTFSGRRIDQRDPIHLTDEGANLLQTGKHTYIFPNPPGLYVNHSCNPNAGVNKGRRLIALKQIEAGEEIRFDYSTTMDDGLWRMECRCTHMNCRQEIRDFCELPADIQDRYVLAGVVPKYLVRNYRRDLIPFVCT